MGEPVEDQQDVRKWLSVRVQTLAWELNRQMAALVRDHFGLTMPEWRIIAHLASRDGASVQLMADLAGMDKAQASRTVTALQRSKLVLREPDPEDRRAVLLHLTDEGRRMFNEIQPISNRRRDWLAALVDPDDLDAFSRVADTLIDALRNAPALTSEENGNDGSA